ncbi:MAG: VOC family protein [Chloroflexota bacterium]
MLKSIRNLDYVVLLCNDLPLMKNFYHDIMGFPIYLETASWIELRVGSVLLTLSKRERPFVGPPLPNESAAVQLAFRVTPQEVDTCYEELKAKGVEIVQPPQIIDKRVWNYWKHRTLFFKDPEGNLLEIYADINIPEEA